jgi:hypothetical protein
MKIVAHTPYGVFQTESVLYSKEKYEEYKEFLQKIHTARNATFKTDNDGLFIMLPEVIKQSIFVIHND